MITLRCPRCGETYFAEETSIGKFIRCTARGCNTLIEVKPQKDQPAKPEKRSRRSSNKTAATIRTPWKRISLTRDNLKAIGFWTAFFIGSLPGDDGVFDDFTATFNGMVVGGIGAGVGAVTGAVVSAASR